MWTSLELKEKQENKENDSKNVVYGANGLFGLAIVTAFTLRSLYFNINLP